MNTPELPQTNSRRELRKALVRLRMEMHRQEIRHESRQLVNPLHRMRTMAGNLQGGLGIKHAPLWGMGAVILLGFLTGKGAKNAGTGSLTRMIRLGTSLIPLIKLVMQGPAQKK
ncbi:hypothetical protein NVV94_18535 [Pseudomonas sp. LS1212]|uniref:hypothetical protein n=1 Tax=Pseudomonas sp. LS1212 TaxID=2972478 RepID=UPI00215BEFBE|nr:hypothetical protein [Pseudomonas sp. LS1212]UVJ42603.1 hypothetical protein NVV94_18535 [Pseudomonas sp. LS1212]